MNKMNSEVVQEQLTVLFFGEIDSSNVAFYKVKIQDLLQRHAIKKIFMDFNDVDFIDSAGIGLILGRYNEMKLVNGEVILTGINKEIMKLFTISGLTKIMKCHSESSKVKL